MKRLYRSETDRMIAGVLGGVAEYFTVDPAFIRLGFTALTILTGIVPLCVAYLLAIWIVPEKT